MERLPNHVLKYDILLRLPVTSVMRFMLTCKTYYDMVRSDHRFAEAHHQRGGPHGKKVLVVESGRAFSWNFDPFLITELTVPKMGGKRMEDVIGSCRGLVCLLSSSSTFVAWNPTTGESRILPVRISFGDRRKWLYGFGYDSVVCDHKLVVIVNPVRTKSHQKVDINQCVVDYSLKSKSAQYKSCSGMIGFEPSKRSAVYSNYHLYWEGEAIDPEYPYKRDDAVLTYNLQAEVFDYLPLPRTNGIFQGIAAIKDGDLCASFYSSVRWPHLFEVWVMKGSSWTLQCSFVNIPYIRNFPLFYKSLWSISGYGSRTKDVSMVVPDDGALIPYILFKGVPKNDEGFVNVESRSWIYEESLLSPITEDAGLNLVGYGRRHQADEAVGVSFELKKRKLYKQLCLKTVICRAWQRTGHCMVGDDCLFAHGEHELRTKVCRNVLDGGTCPSGKECKYRHDLTELETAYYGDGHPLNNKRIRE